MVHILGLERLFATCGPLTAGNSSILDRALLEVSRPVMVLGALFTGRPFLMSKSGWQSTSLSQDTLARPDLFLVTMAESDLSVLIGNLAQLPIIFMDRVACIRQKETNNSSCGSENELWTEVDQFLQSLHAWRTSWGNEDRNKIKAVIPVTEADGTHPVPWRTTFQFKDVKTATAFVLYHATMILLTSVPLSLLQAGLHPPFQTIDECGDLGFDAGQLINDIEKSAVSICQSLGHVLQLLRSSQHQRGLYVFFSIHVVRRTFIHMGWSSELTWLDAIHRVMLSTTSLRMWANVEMSDKFIGFHRGLFSIGKQCSKTSISHSQDRC